MWNQADALILQAIAYASRWRRRDLSHVIAAYDSINVDIPSRETLERAVNKLTAAGLVVAARDQLKATRAGRRIVRGAGGWKQRIRELSPLIEAELQAVPVPGESGQWKLTDADWAAAHERYISRVG